MKSNFQNAVEFLYKKEIGINLEEFIREEDFFSHKLNDSIVLIREKSRNLIMCCLSLATQKGDFISIHFDEACNYSVIISMKPSQPHWDWEECIISGSLYGSQRITDYVDLSQNYELLSLYKKFANKKIDQIKKYFDNAPVS